METSTEGGVNMRVEAQNQTVKLCLKKAWKKIKSTATFNSTRRSTAAQWCPTANCRPCCRQYATVKTKIATLSSTIWVYCIQKGLSKHTHTHIKNILLFYLFWRSCGVGAWMSPSHEKPHISLTVKGNSLGSQLLSTQRCQGGHFSHVSSAPPWLLWHLSHNSLRVSRKPCFASVMWRAWTAAHFPPSLYHKYSAHCGESGLTLVLLRAKQKSWP